MMWSERVVNHLFVYWNGKIIYKRWVDENGEKTESSALFNEGWPTVRVTPNA